MEQENQPPLLERRLRLSRPERPLENERLRFREVPLRRQAEITAELAERPDPLEPVDHNVSSHVARRPDHDDRRLLATLRERREKPLLPLRPADPERLMAQVELVELDLEQGALSSTRQRKRRRARESVHLSRSGNQTGV
jgi:hypothetical protein